MPERSESIEVWRCIGRLNGPLELITLYLYWMCSFLVVSFEFLQCSDSGRVCSYVSWFCKVVILFSKKHRFKPDGWNSFNICFVFFRFLLLFWTKIETQRFRKMRDLNEKNNKIWFNLSFWAAAHMRSKKDNTIFCRFFFLCVRLVLAGLNWVRHSLASTYVFVLPFKFNIVFEHSLMQPNAKWNSK